MALLTLLCRLASPQQKTSAAGQPDIDISGLWLVQDPGSGSWTDFFENSTGRAPILPEIEKNRQESAARQRAGDIVNRTAASDECPSGNAPSYSALLPMLMATSRPLNIVQGREEILIGSESDRARFIYLDGRDHSIVKSKNYKPTGMGHSIARWEGNTLVVDVTGLNDETWLGGDIGGKAIYTSIHSDKEHVIERWSRQGDVLTYNATVEDPVMFTRPWVITPRHVHIASPDDHLEELFCTPESAGNGHYVKPNPEDRDIKNKCSGHRCE